MSYSVFCYFFFLLLSNKRNKIYSKQTALNIKHSLDNGSYIVVVVNLKYLIIGLYLGPRRSKEDWAMTVKMMNLKKKADQKPEENYQEKGKLQEEKPQTFWQR